MHTKIDQKTLENISQETKLMMVEEESLKNRGSFEASFNCWYLSRNEMPHKERGENQLIAWKINDWDTTYEEWAELLLIRKIYDLPGFSINRPNDRSVEKFHVHLFD